MVRRNLKLSVSLKIKHVMEFLTVPMDLMRTKIFAQVSNVSYIIVLTRLNINVICDYPNTFDGITKFRAIRLPTWPILMWRW